MKFILPFFCALIVPLGIRDAYSVQPTVSEKAISVMEKTRPRVQQELATKGFQLGGPIFIRIFKLPGNLEVWIKKDDKYQLFKSYPICRYSGYPGPKLGEGDWQSPEGFYSVSSSRMNPNSNYHLSFNIGYPNEFDRAKNRTGSSIMVHGNCSSRGCFAMGDHRMEEIYLLAHSALSCGQEEFSVHVFPFKLNAQNMFKFRSSPWIRFWKTLKPGFDAFELTRQVPEISVHDGRYVINDTVRIAMADNTEDHRKERPHNDRE